MSLFLRQLCTAILFASCTYEPPRVASEYYANPVAYADQTTDHPRRQELQAYLDHAVAEGLPGAALLVRTPDDGIWAGASGWADIASGVRWKPSMVARVGSVTKLFAAAAMLPLCEERGIPLDAAVRPYLDREVVDAIENANEATFRQMLNHTSGIFDYVKSTDLLFDALGSYDYEYQPKERLLEYAYGQDAKHAPGAGWSYTSTPFLLLEQAAERLSGTASEELMGELVIDPLDLRSTRYRPSVAHTPGLVRGYADIFADGDLVDTTDTALERFHFDGGVTSNVYDLAKFLDGLLDGDLLSTNAREALLDTVPTRGSSERGTDFYGAGVIAEQHPDFGRVVGHSGTTVGYSAHVYRIEELGITYAAIVNGSQHSVEARSYRWFSPLKHDDILRLVAGDH
jgi:D-alanyl-D-alanine carboxypeptidase